VISRICGLVTPCSNFSFLSYFGASLVEAAARAELVIAIDPVGALDHLRLFGEALAKAACVRLGIDEQRDAKQVDRLRHLENQRIPESVLQLFQSLRIVGNRASHEGQGTQEQAFTQLKIAWQLAIWFQRAFGSNRKFDPGPFVPIENACYVSRIDHLRCTAARVRFLSLEALLGPLPSLNLTGIDWVIVGGESGPSARPMSSEWVTEIRDQCRRAAVPFFFKQWGGTNKKKAGRTLEGRTWDEMPRVGRERTLISSNARTLLATG
jgi:hypothetical protein